MLAPSSPWTPAGTVPAPSLCAVQMPCMSMYRSRTFMFAPHLKAGAGAAAEACAATLTVLARPALPVLLLATGLVLPKTACAKPALLPSLHAAGLAFSTGTALVVARPRLGRSVGARIDSAMVTSLVQA